MKEFNIKYDSFEKDDDVLNGHHCQEFKTLNSNIVKILKQEFRNILSPIAVSLHVDEFIIKLSINQLKKNAFDKAIVCVECFVEFNNLQGFLRIKNNTDAVDGFLTFDLDVSLYDLTKKIKSINPSDVYIPINLIYFEDEMSFEKDFKLSNFNIKNREENSLIFDFNEEVYSFFKYLKENRIFVFDKVCDGIMVHYNFSSKSKAWISFLTPSNKQKNINKVEFFEMKDLTKKDILKTMVSSDLLAVEAFEIYKNGDDLKYIFDVSKLLGY